MKNTLMALLTSLVAVSLSAQEPIRLYEGIAPGSENWDWTEPDWSMMGIAANVVDPTITPYIPENPNGISVILCPGGAFHMLSMAQEGAAIAKALNERGIAAFVLKYRLVHDDEQMSQLQKIMQGGYDGGAALMEKVSRPVVPLMVADGLAAVRFVREHAAEYGLDPHKIGIEGSSAGGCVSVSTAMSAATPEETPDFVASTYGYQPLAIGENTPDIPLFLAAATDDSAVPVGCSIRYYERWHNAGRPVEMHLYQKGEHGFAGKEGLEGTIARWLDDFVDWMMMNFGEGVAAVLPNDSVR